MRTRTVGRLALASLVGAVATLGATRARADVAAGGCDPATLTCSVGGAALSTKIITPLPTVIDSGPMGSGSINVRARFTVDLVGTDPLLKIDMPKGALVQATWNEAGFINVKTVTDAAVKGTMSAHYTLKPSLEATIYGITVGFDAAQLINKLPGGSFNYDAKASTPMASVAFLPTVLRGAPPALDQSTLFSLPFSDLGISTGIAEGTLTLQASARPTFTYITKQVRLDSQSISTATGIAKLPVGDDNFLDLSAQISGEIQLGGALDIKPVVKLDSVGPIPTFGTKVGFSVASPPIGGAPLPVTFGSTTIHLPLPNVKVPTATLGMGNSAPGKPISKNVTIDSPGELGGRMTFKSSDPQFTVPTGEITVSSKGKYELAVGFNPASDAPASAIITVQSNDPGEPTQTFNVAANGAAGSDGSDDGSPGHRSGGGALLGVPDESGCAIASTGKSAGGPSTYGLVGLGLGLAALARRRRNH